MTLRFLGIRFETDDPETQEIVSRGNDSEIRTKCPKLILAVTKALQEIHRRGVPAGSMRYADGKVTLRAGTQFASPPAIVVV